MRKVIFFFIRISAHFRKKNNAGRILNQGLEKLNHLTTSEYFRATNHYKNKSIDLILYRRLRIELFEKEGKHLIFNYEY